MDLGTEEVNAGLEEELPKIRRDLTSALDFARMAGVGEQIDLRSLRSFISKTSETIKAASEAKETLDEVIASVDEYTAGGGAFEEVLEEVERLSELGFEEEDLRGLRTDLTSRNTDRVEAAKERIFEGADVTITDLSETMAEAMRDFSEQVGEVGEQAAGRVLDSIIASVKSGETRGLSVGQLRQKAVDYGISPEELEELRDVADGPEDQMEKLRDLIQGREEQRSEEIRGMLTGVYGDDVRAVGATPEQLAEQMRQSALDPNDSSRTALGSLNEAVRNRAITSEQAAGLQDASDQDIMAAVAPALGQQQFNQQRPGGTLRTAGSQALKAGGGPAALATGVVRGGLDLATPGGQSMLEAGGQAAGSFGSAAGAGIGATLGGALGLPFGGVGAIPGALVGGAIGAVAGGTLEDVAQPYISYVQQQRDFNRMFGLDSEGPSMNPLGMFTGGVDDRPEEYEQLRRSQIDARLENPAVSGQEIDALTESLANMNLTAGQTAEALDNATRLVGEYGMTAEAAAYVTAVGTRSSEGSQVTEEVVGRQRERVAGRGISGQQYDQMIQGGQAISERVGEQAGMDIAQETTETVSNFTPQNQQDFIASGGDKDLNQLRAMFTENPMLLLQFGGDPTLMQESPYEADGSTLRPEFVGAMNTGVYRMVETIMGGANLPVGAGRAEVPQAAYPRLQQYIEGIGLPLGLQEVLTLSEELGRNPEIFEESTQTIEREAVRAGAEMRVETGQGAVNASEDKIVRGDPSEDIGVGGELARMGGDIGLDRLPFIGKAFDRRPGRSGLIGTKRSERGRASLKGVVGEAEGEQKGLAGLSNIEGFDIGELGVAGSEEDLGDLVSAERNGTRRFREQRERMMAGDLRYNIEGGTRGGEGYTSGEIRELVASGQAVVGDEGGLKLTEESRRRGGEPKSVDVKVTASDALSSMFNFEAQDDRRTSGGKMAHSDARARRDRKGEKMPKNARVR